MASAILTLSTLSADPVFALQTLPVERDSVDGSAVAGEISCPRIWFDKTYCASRARILCPDGSAVTNFRRSPHHIRRTFYFECETVEVSK